MSSFSDNNLVKKLTELNGTQQSIQTLSLWLIHHRKHSKTIVQVWLRELKKGRHEILKMFNHIFDSQRIFFFRQRRVNIWTFKIGFDICPPYANMM